MPRTKNSKSAPEFFSRQVSSAQRFFLDLSPPKNRNLVVVCGGRERCTPDYAIHRTTLPFYCIEFVARGHGTATLQGRTHKLQAGRLYSYGPRIQQDITADPDDPPEKYFVAFCGTQAHRLLRSCNLLPTHAVQVFPPNEVQAVFDELIHNGLKGSRYSGSICAKLLECLALKIAEAQTPLDEAEKLSFTTYQKCRRHIQENFKNLKELQQIGGECHIDAAYLCRLFKRYDHQSPYQYLLKLKMNFAAELLREPGALVKQVAEKIGFSDPFHFSRAFKGVFGLAPDDFRKWH